MSSYALPSRRFRFLATALGLIGMIWEYFFNARIIHTSKECVCACVCVIVGFLFHNSRDGNFRKPPVASHTHSRTHRRALSVSRLSSRLPHYVYTFCFAVERKTAAAGVRCYIHTNCRPFVLSRAYTLGARGGGGNYEFQRVYYIPFESHERSPIIIIIIIIIYTQRKNPNTL